MIGGVALASLPGCGSSNDGPDSKQEAKNVDVAKGMRSYFDQAHGDYSALSPADKAAFIKLAGSEDKAEQYWKLMKEGPGGASRGPATTSSSGQ